MTAALHNDATASPCCGGAMCPGNQEGRFAGFPTRSLSALRGPAVDGQLVWWSIR